MSRVIYDGKEWYVVGIDDKNHLHLRARDEEEVVSASEVRWIVK